MPGTTGGLTLGRVLTTYRPAAFLLAACLACAHGETAGPVLAPEGARSVPDKAATVSAERAEGTPNSGAPDAVVEAARARALRVTAVRANVDRLLSAQARLLWQAWTTGVPLDLAPAMAGHEVLRSRETVRAVREERDVAVGDDRRALSLLHAFLVGEYLADAASGVVAPAAWLTWNGARIPSSSVPGLLATERDATRRDDLYQAWVTAERGRAALVTARWKAIDAAIRRLGYGTMPEIVVELRGEPTESLATLASSVLEVTEPTYRALIGALAEREAGKQLLRLRGGDLPRVLRGTEPSAPPAERVVSAAHGALTRIGLDLAAVPGIVIDAGARPGKDARALTLPVDVPGSVRVSYVPRAGVDALRGLLHELGVAAYYGSVRSPVAEFRRLGMVTVEAWAVLLEDLAGDPDWLVDAVGLSADQIDVAVRAAAARRLHQARVLAGRVLVETARMRVPSSGATELRAIVERVMTRPVATDELDLFLLERDPLLESADGLRAILLASHAATYLSDHTRTAWWKAPAAGTLLTALLTDGSRLAPQDLARSLGAPALDATALATWCRTRALGTGLRPDASASITR